MSIKLATTTAVLLSLAASPLMAAPVYNIDNYGLVLQEKEKAFLALQEEAFLAPYFQANASFGRLSSIRFDDGLSSNDFSESKPGYDLQLGLSHLGGGFSVDTALYFSDLGKPKNELDESLSIQSYGLKFAFGLPTTPKSTTSLILGAGFMKAKMETEKEEGGQVSVGLGYRYDFNKSISWNINAEHY